MACPRWPCCNPADCHYLIYVCNSNALYDDDFSLSLNGNDLGIVDFSRDVCVGRLFTTAEDLSLQGLDIFSGEANLCYSGVTITTIPKEYLEINNGRTNTFSMDRITDRGNGNYGVVRAYSVYKDPYTQLWNTLENLLFLHYGTSNNNFSFSIGRCAIKTFPCCSSGLVMARKLYATLISQGSSCSLLNGTSIEMRNDFFVSPSYYSTTVINPTPGWRIEAILSCVNRPPSFDKVLNLQVNLYATSSPIQVWRYSIKMDFPMFVCSRPFLLDMETSYSLEQVFSGQPLPAGCEEQGTLRLVITE